MIDERFSLAAFQAQNGSSEVSSELAKALQIEIARDMMSELRGSAEKIASRLRALGHPFAEAEYDVDPEGMASVTFLTPPGASTNERGLRFTLDLVVSAAFPDRETEEFPDDEVSGLISG